MDTAAGLGVEEQVELWHDMAAGAASGWDFSSRWLRDGKNLSTCFTTSILPADLNSFLYRVPSQPPEGSATAGWVAS